MFGAALLAAVVECVTVTVGWLVIVPGALAVDTWPVRPVVGTGPGAAALVAVSAAEALSGLISPPEHELPEH
jgi:hypothetical protein